MHAVTASTFGGKIFVVGVRNPDPLSLNAPPTVDLFIGGGWNDATGDSYPDWLEVTFNGEKTITEANVFTVQDAFAAPAEPGEGMTFTKYGVTQFDVQAWDGAQWATASGGSVTGNNLVRLQPYQGDGSLLEAVWLC